MQTQSEGQIITTTSGTYYLWALPTERDCEIELWLRWSLDGKKCTLNPHFNGVMEAELKLQAVLTEGEAKLSEGCFRFIYDRGIGDTDYVLHTPLIFTCPNFDCAENFVLPHTTRVQLCGIGADLTCYEDRATYRAMRKMPLPEQWQLETIFASDFVGDDGEFDLDAKSPIAYITGKVVETHIMTNSATGYDFSWAVIDVGDYGELDVVAAPEGLHGFLREGCMVDGTIWLSGRLLDV